MSWLEHYRTNKNAVWIKCKLTNGEELFYDKFAGWLSLKEKCLRENLFFSRLSLQFRSHEVELDVDNCDGVYLIRSLLGEFGGRTRQYFTFGRVDGENVSKKMWLVPELVADKQRVDHVSECFSEAIIPNVLKETPTNREEQVQAPIDG